MAAQPEVLRIGYLVGANQVRSERQKSVQCLTEHPLTGSVLQVPSAQVVCYAVAGHVLQRSIDRNAACLSSKHHRQFDLIVGLGGFSWNRDLLPVRCERIGVLRKQDWHFGNLSPCFHGMSAVVETNTHNLADNRQAWLQHDVCLAAPRRPSSLGTLECWSKTLRQSGPVCRTIEDLPSAAEVDQAIVGGDAHVGAMLTAKEQQLHQS